jgi:uncharacterized protein YlxP (DUF503 family)
VVVAIAVFVFHLPGCRGLKEKRAFLRPLKTRLRGDFEISASEVAHQDLLQRAALGVAAVGAGREALEPLLAKVVGWVESYAEENGAELASVKHEFLNYGDVGALGSPFGEGGDDTDDTDDTVAPRARGEDER